MPLATLEQDILNSIKLQGGIKRIELRSWYPATPFDQFRIALAELVATGEIIEFEYVYNGVREYFYIPGPTEIKIRGKGI